MLAAGLLALSLYVLAIGPLYRLFGEHPPAWVAKTMAVVYTPLGELAKRSENVSYYLEQYLHLWERKP